MAKIAIALLVAYFIYLAVQRARAESEAWNFEFSNVRWDWLLLASVSYVFGMMPMGLNWHRLLTATEQHVPRWDAVRTHFISQLGKYVPGKACVPAIRFALLSRYKLDPATTFVTMASETLAMMSVGAVVGASVVAVVYRTNAQIALVAVGVALLAGLPIIPPVLQRVVRFLQQRKAKRNPNGVGEEARDVTGNLTWSVLLPGWLGIVPGWCLLGLSMFATMKALNLPATESMSLVELPWITASYAISVVLGFASMLPGGVGVRELAMKELIAPTYGEQVGLLAAMLHRMMSLSSELVVSTILYLTRPKSED